MMIQNNNILSQFVFFFSAQGGYCFMQADGYEQTDFESKPDQLQQKTAVFSTKKKPFPLIFKNN